MINPDEYDENDEKMIKNQQLLLNFFRVYLNEHQEFFKPRVIKWVNSKTEEELAFYFSDEAAVKKTYKDIETGEIFHTKEDILKSMFEDEDEE